MFYIHSKDCHHTMFYCLCCCYYVHIEVLVAINIAKIASILCCCHYYVCVRHKTSDSDRPGIVLVPTCAQFDSSGLRKHNTTFAQLECDPRISAHC